jgi:hypothetical protein
LKQKNEVKVAKFSELLSSTIIASEYNISEHFLSQFFFAIIPFYVCRWEKRSPLLHLGERTLPMANYIIAASITATKEAKSMNQVCLKQQQQQHQTTMYVANDD